MKYFSSFKLKTAGFTLVELMVAITISLIILAAVSSLFVSSKKTYTTQDRLARVQENGRFAMQFITRDLRMAGYTGCLNKLILNTTYFNQSNTTVTTPDVPIAATTATTTDTITISFVEPMSLASLNADMSSPNADIVTSTETSGIAKGDMLIISDCSSADLFQVTDISTNTTTHKTTISHIAGTTNPAPGNASSNLSKAYKSTAKIIRFSTRTYSIATGASGNPALFRADNGNPGAELVDGIQSIKILYGEDTDTPTATTATDGVPNIYRNASSVSNWGMVTSARLGILAQTVDQKDTEIDSGSYDVDGDGTNEFSNIGDRNTRRIFRSTVLMRNMRCKQSPAPLSCQKS